jgi:hypothetical protein
MTSQGAEPGRTWVLPSHRYFFTGYIFPTSVISMFGFSVFVPVTVLSLSLSLSLSSDLFSAHAFCLCLPLCVCVCACSLLCGYFRFVSSVSTLLACSLSFYVEYMLAWLAHTRVDYSSVSLLQTISLDRSSSIKLLIAMMFLWLPNEASSFVHFTEAFYHRPKSLSVIFFLNSKERFCYKSKNLQ